MNRRLALAGATIALLLGVLAAPAAAEVDPEFGWDHRAATIGGSYTLLTGQFAGDSATDLLFYGPGAIADSLWIGNEGGRGANAFTKKNLSIGGTYVPVVGDFGGDDYTDILWYGRGSASDALWISTETAGYFSSRPLAIGGTYQPQVLVDFRAEGAKDDVLFLGPGAAPDYLWHFRETLGSDTIGPGTYASRTLKVNGAYQLVVGDFSGDYLDDVVLYQPGTAPDYKWVSTPSGAFTQTSLTVNGRYQPATIRRADVDGIYWWASGAPNEAYWTSDGTSFRSRPVVQYPEETGRAQTFGAGVLIQSDTGRDGFVYGDGAAADTYLLANQQHDFGTATQATAGDFDDDGLLDTLWYGRGSARDEIWYGIEATSASARGAQPTSPAPPASPAPKTSPVVER